MRNSVRRDAAEQPSNTRLSIPVSAHLALALAHAAKRDDRSMNSYVRVAVLAKLRVDGFEPNEMDR